MGYVLRVRLASFFTGAALASAAGIYFLHKDYKIAHHSMSQQMNSLYESLDGRLSAIEKLKQQSMHNRQNKSSSQTSISKQE
ncbi:transmembrane [Olea europaea subsp. europaea]|uniref:Transmembrane n=1 Tax=Olea europaea subsp. europaea TaxID=158383 RepID=A0A8S0RYQ5_OLEEU|nr:transmembrane [Olea europaea subsp. europaea]